jgi:hypothetical protein
MSDPANPMMAVRDSHQLTVRTSVRPSPRSLVHIWQPRLPGVAAYSRKPVGDVGVRLLGPNPASPHPSDHDRLLGDAGSCPQRWDSVCMGLGCPASQGLAHIMPDIDRHQVISARPLVLRTKTFAVPWVVSTVGYRPMRQVAGTSLEPVATPWPQFGHSYR